ncbi:hypothetical protein [Enterobacter mori]|uniref:hypothetical protein n=1 Tax=Enterobacter mori TaxID=539813 RepID=UPI003B844CF9
MMILDNPELSASLPWGGKFGGQQILVFWLLPLNEGVGLVSFMVGPAKHRYMDCRHKKARLNARPFVLLPALFQTELFSKPVKGANAYDTLHAAGKLLPVLTNKTGYQFSLSLR